ncbi:MAG TPA: DUF3667 domain-containing protein [Longimicrobium sp.]|jgi:hypothetical protein|uniref:DUF3667 domain-containing protein n=1 Tax=Longimicrobium sp. TaxID=2029185 RepID=UPI002EDB4C55
MPDPTAAPPPFPSAAAGLPDPRGEPPAPISPIRRQRWWAPETRRTPDRPCLNCGDTTVGFFCRNCGQRKADVRVSLRRMLMEVMDDQLSLNSTLPRTIGALLFRPGHLTAEYVQGRIMRYVPPFRLYLVTSVLFFILLPVVADVNRIADEVAMETEQDDARERAQDSARIAGQRARADSARARIAAVRRGEAPKDRTIAPPLPPVPPKPDSGKVDLNLAFSDTSRVPGWLKPLNRRLQRTEDRLESMPPREALRTALAAMEENAPKGVFLMMPLFAFILKLLYVRRKRFYVEHFVFALHVHAMAFVLFTVGMLVPSDTPVRGILGLWMVLYVFLAMKKVYAQGIVRTFLKFAMLGGAYMVFGMLVGGIATIVFAALSM